MRTHECKHAKMPEPCKTDLEADYESANPR